jgi:2-dehydro-3-deoxyglucarate aldolase/4-hydroxy-2-oxoheptanedioate aldolase
MGKTGQLTDPEVQDAIRSVKETAQRANMPMGIFCATAEAAKPFIQDGYTLVAVGMDGMLISQLAKNITGSLK